MGSVVAKAIVRFVLEGSGAFSSVCNARQATGRVVAMRRSLTPASQSGNWVNRFRTSTVQPAVRPPDWSCLSAEQTRRWGIFQEEKARPWPWIMHTAADELGEGMPLEFDEVVDCLQAGQNPDDIEESMPDLGGGDDDLDF